MNQLKIIDNEFGLSEMNGRPVVSSRKIAEAFDKRHDHILRDIGKITDPKSGVSESFTRRNFLPSKYKDPTGRILAEFLLTRDGFVILVMGYSGTKALKFKEAYINKFNEMDQYIAALNTARLEFPELTQAILSIRIFSYFAYMRICKHHRIVLHMKAVSRRGKSDYFVNMFI